MAAGSLSGSEMRSVHVELVGLLFVVWGVMTILVGLSAVALGFGAAALVQSPERQDGSQLAAGFAVAALVVLAIVAMVWGFAHLIVGVPLRRYRPWARLAALMLGTVDLLLVPFGTALGGYTLWTLLGENRRSLFTNAPGAADRVGFHNREGQSA
jgi:hypothetical protein